jgi:hypothetical protein
MPWAFDPVTFDGVSLTASPFQNVYFKWEAAPMAAFDREPVELRIPGDYSFPEVARSQIGASTHLELHFQTVDDSIGTLYTIRRLFDRYKGDVVLTVNDSLGLGWKTTVRIVELRERFMDMWVVKLHLRRPIWERTASTTDGPRTFTASPTSFDLTVGGVVRAYPEFTLTPTAAKTAANDYRFRRHCIIAWRSELEGQDAAGNAYPIDVCNDAFDTAAEIAAGRMQADGDDLRVFVDGREFPRTLDGINTTTTKVWTPIYFSPARSVSLAVAAAAGTPADGASWAINDPLNDSLEGWPEQGVFYVDTEAVWYGQRTETEFQLIDRGYRDTTAAAHAAAATGYWVEHEIQVVYGHSAATAPTARTWGISTSLSTNLAHTANQFFTSVTPGERPGQMLARFTEDNVKAAGISLADGPSMSFADKVPGALRYPFNNAEFYAPCGIKAAASAIAFDIQDGTIALGTDESDVLLNGRIFGVEIDTGVETLLATYNRAARDAGAAKTITPSTVLSRLRFNVIYRAIVGAGWDIVSATYTSIGLGSAGKLGNASVAQMLTVDAEATVEEIALVLKENTGADTRAIDMVLFYVTGATDPDTGSLEVFNYTIPNAALATTFTWVVVPTVDSVIAAGDYAVLLAGQAAGAGTLSWGEYISQNGRGGTWIETAGVWSAKSRARDLGCVLLGDGSVVQADAPSNLEGFLTFDNIVFTFDDTTPRTPLCAMAPRVDIYPIRTRVAHTDLGIYFDLLYLCKLNDSLKVRSKTKEVIVNETLKQYAPYAIQPSDLENWFYLRGTDVAADNTITLSEATAGGGSSLSVTTVWADSWA